QLLIEDPKTIFFHISKELAGILKQLGHYVTPMGITHRIDTETYSPKANSHATLHYQINRARKEGVNIIERPLSQVSSESLEALSYRWLQTKPTNTRYLGFLLRQNIFKPIPGTRWLFAYKNSKLIGFHSYFPTIKENSVVSYTAEFTRICPSAPKGTNALLTHTAITTFQKENIKTVSLGLAPFAPLSSPPHISNAPLTEFIFKLIYQHGNWIMNFKGLAMHKNHYRAHKEPIYFASPNPLPIWRLFKAYRLMTNGH
ncbi:MAG: phosphatidylglycerol lysyltransferase domain-containing protein, partial [bacterium]|nr:phosphatidylglycerol lysyltransferase domain-containing protein [bacterium]